MTYLSLSLSIYIYISKLAYARRALVVGGYDVVALGRGQMGSALMGSLRISCFLTEGPFGYSR